MKCIYVYVYIYMHIYMHIYMYMYICIYVYMIYYLFIPRTMCEELKASYTSALRPHTLVH